jgi:hypothetical protein
MLQQRPTSDDETGWAIYHDSFRQHLLESETVSAYRERTQERWLEVCKDWKALASQEPSLHRYILRHYAEHLYEKCPMTNERMTNEQMTKYAELCRLALDSDFKQAQTEHLPDEPNLPLKTVQRALEVAIQLEDAPMMARLLIEHAKRAQEETPLQAWRRGHRERALRTATENIFEQRNHKLGTLWSLLLAWVAESEGKSEEERSWSKRFLDEVRKRWEEGKLEKLRDWGWGGWEGKMAAFLLGELGKVEGAVEVAGLVLGNVSKRELAASLALKELFDQALKVAEGIEEAWERAEALRAIAEGMAKAGMLDQALKVAEGIEKADERARALGEIAGGMAKAGMFDQALKVAEGIEKAEKRAWALREIAGEMAKAGMEDWAKEVFDQALKVAEGIEKADERARALREIAGEMAKAGMFDRALKVAEGIEEAEKRAWALREIAREMAKAGEVEGAVGIVEREMAVRTEGLPSILRALAERAKQGDGRSKEGFLKLLPWCGWSLEFACYACGLLHQLYPERGEEIAGVVSSE